MKTYLTFTVLAVVALTSSASVLDFLQPQKSDGVSRVGVLSSEASILTTLSVVFVVTDTTVKNEEAEILAQITSNKSPAVSVLLAPEGIPKDTVAGNIVVFFNGRRYPYHGLQNAATLIKFLSMLDSSGIKLISGKLDKMAFDHATGTKLIGYFVDSSAEHQVYQQAAVLFGAQVSFYAVTDPIVAKHLKLNTTGQIHIVRDFDKTPTPCRVNPATLVDIQQLIVLNKDQFIKITPLNAMDPAHNRGSALILVTDSTPLSFHLRRIIARSQRNATLPVPKILWVDTDDFPTADIASQALLGPARLPALGYWNEAATKVDWMDLTVLSQAPVDRIQEEANLLLIKNFLAARAAPPPPPATKTEL